MSVTHAEIADVAARADESALARKLAVVVALVGLGDFLFFRHPLGLSLAIFLLAVETAAILVAGVTRKKVIACAAIGAATLAPLIEDVDFLSVVIASCGAGAIALIANGGMDGRFPRPLFQVLRFLAKGPFRVLIEAPGVATGLLTGRAVGVSGRALVAWMLPLGLGCVFLALFSAANPVVEGWLDEIDFRPLLALMDISRVAFWLFLVAVVWPFVLFRRRKSGGADIVSPRSAAAAVERPESGGFRSIFFGEIAILRSLVLFNAMFAVQTALDVEILWRGRGLPAGISFAGYAHRGAYPLMVTGLLAGAFVVLAMRPGASVRRSASIRALVYLWTAQNIALAVSSLHRLELYVQAYSLTYWRVAAFVWMGLVAAGLVLILVQISTRRSNGWLLSAITSAAVLALYVCALVNFDFVIADYNIRHSGQVSAESAPLDYNYMESLGPGAIPALDAALATPEFRSISRDLRRIRADLIEIEAARLTDWRAWTARDWRLSRYLDARSAGAGKP
jgi:hypothetical protein